jgi:hypothetical protein
LRDLGGEFQASGQKMLGFECKLEASARASDQIGPVDELSHVTASVTDPRAILDQLASILVEKGNPVLALP